MMILPLEKVLEHVGNTGERLLLGEEISGTDRVVGSFACALMVWLMHNNPEYLVESCEKLSDEMYATDKDILQ